MQLPEVVVASEHVLHTPTVSPDVQALHDRPAPGFQPPSHQIPGGQLDGIPVVVVPSVHSVQDG